MQMESQTTEELIPCLPMTQCPFCCWEAGQTLLRAFLAKPYNAAKDPNFDRLNQSPDLLRRWRVRQMRSLPSCWRMTQTPSAAGRQARPC